MPFGNDSLLGMIEYVQFFTGYRQDFTGHQILADIRIPAAQLFVRILRDLKESNGQDHLIAWVQAWRVKGSQGTTVHQVSFDTLSEERGQVAKRISEFLLKNLTIENGGSVSPQDFIDTVDTIPSIFTPASGNQMAGAFFFNLFGRYALVVVLLALAAAVLRKNAMAEMQKKRDSLVR